MLLPLSGLKEQGPSWCGSY